MKILLISGSLRRNSFNTQLALFAKKALENECEVMMPDYRALPIFDQDGETDQLPIVESLREDFQWADGVWFFTPEYNLMLPAALKNLIDWMSRPLDPSNWKTSVLRGKHACISAAGGKSAAASARDQLAALLKFCGVSVDPQSLGIALTPAEFQANAFEDPARIQALIEEQAKDFIAWLKEQPAADLH